MPGKAMILAAGKGTRLHPITESKPKALVPFKGVPMLELVIGKLISQGFSELVINVHHFKDQIMDFVNEKNGFGANVSFSVEEELLDTGGGIKKAIPLLGQEPVLFHNIDIISNVDLKQFYADHISWGGLASLAVKERPTSRQLLFGPDFLLSGWHHPENRIRIISRKNRKGYYETAFSGIYILDPQIFNLFPDEKIFSVMPWLLELSGQHDILGWDHSSDFWYDLGSLENLKMAERNVEI